MSQATDIRSKQGLRLWLKLLSTTGLIEKKIRQKLRDEFETTLPRFDVLAELARKPNGTTMGDLSDMLMVSKGNLTGLSRRLEEDGLIARASLPSDQRTQLLFITRRGKAAFEAMAKEHEQWVSSLLSPLADEEVDQLLNLLNKFNHSVEKMER